jgi:hypothetical protein
MPELGVAAIALGVPSATQSKSNRLTQMFSPSRHRQSSANNAYDPLLLVIDLTRFVFATLEGPQNLKRSLLFLHDVELPLAVGC